MKAYNVPQAKLTSECWIVQFVGFEACEDCEARDTEDCGGKNIRKTGKNSMGHPVPIGVRTK